MGLQFAAIYGEAEIQLGVGSDPAAPIPDIGTEHVGLGVEHEVSAEWLVEARWVIWTQHTSSVMVYNTGMKIVFFLKWND